MSNSSVEAADLLRTMLSELRGSDPDRALQVLLAPTNAKPALVALFAFNVELSRIAAAVTQPVAGMIRLQWWRDGITATVEGGTAPAHPVLEAISQSGLGTKLPLDDLTALIEGREADLDATPVQGPADLERRARSTAGQLNLLVARLSDPRPSSLEASPASGTAYGMIGILRALPFALRRPTDGEGPAPPTPDALRDVAAATVARARHLLATQPKIYGRRAGSHQVLAQLARRDAARLEAAGFDVFAAGVMERPPWVGPLVLLSNLAGRW